MQNSKNKPKDKRNFGFGRKLRYALCMALNVFYGHQQHFGTRRAHIYRIRVFARFCERLGVLDARLITQSTLDAYGAYLRVRIIENYVWPDGASDERVSVAYAHNLVSTANTALVAIRGNGRIRVSARQTLGVSRKHVRQEQAEADIALVDQAGSKMIAKGDMRGAAVLFLTRYWGMRPQEATLQNLDRMHAEIIASGAASILEGCKGGRKDPSRRLPATPERLAALKFALAARPEKSLCLLAGGENVRLFYQRELNRCRRILKSVGIPSYRELRAGFAADVYEDITGIRPLQGIVVDPTLDKVARQYVARVLGHGREQVSSCYVGGY